MTRHPFDSDELGRSEPEMDAVGSALERYASKVGDEPPAALAARIQAAIDEEPAPSRGWWASLLALFSPSRGPARLALASVVVVAAVVGAVALGELADRARTNLGASPTPSPSTIATPTPTPTVPPTPTRTPIPSPTPSESPPAAEPSATDDDDGEIETPEPTESDDDNSGSGSGDDNSGPGGGGGDD